MIIEKLEPKYYYILENYNIDLSNAYLVSYKQGEIVFLEGSKMEYLLFVVSGCAKIYTSTQDGKELILCFYVWDGILGDIELMTSSYLATTTVKALDDFVCIGLPYLKYAQILKNNIKFVNTIATQLALKLTKTSESGKIIALSSVKQRLKQYIIENSLDGFFNIPLTDVACSIGASYRHTLRVIKILCSEKFICKQNNGYKIFNNNICSD